MKKKILLSFMLVCICVFTFYTLNVSSSSNEICGKNANYEIDNNGVLTISGTGEMFNWDIEDDKNPPWYDIRTSIKTIVINDGITNISKDAFSGFENLERIQIPNSVTDIGQGAFWNCKSLEKISLPESIIGLGREVFYGCYKLSEITLPAGIKGIANYTFMFCTSLKKITISGDIEYIGNYAFYDCKVLNNLLIPNTIDYIGDYTFQGCSSLKTVYYNGTQEQYSNIRIFTHNQPFADAEKIYFKHNVIIYDIDGNKISDKIQNKNESIDLSSIAIPSKGLLKLYRDKELTQEYSPDTPISENLTLYADIVEINKLKISGAEKADIGQHSVTYSVSFATDKSAAYLIAATEYPETLILKNIESTDFDINSETIDGITYLNCTYKSGNMPTNKTLRAFDLIFDISEGAKPNDTLTIKFAGDETYLAGSDGKTYDFDELGSAQVKINPILVKSISISGEAEIDKETKYTAVILPENATNKEIEWTADNDGIASISADGVLTPIKSGTVKITAAAKDGSGIFAEKSVNVKVYARISSLASNIGVWDKDFAAGETEYVIYVPKDAKAIKLTATHNDSDGKLTSGTKTLFSGRAVNFLLSGDETVIDMTYTAAGYTDGTYTVKVKKFEGTRTNVSSDGKSFEIKPTNIASGNTVIFVLYDGENLIETKYEVYGGADISFTTDKAYTGAAVMVWDDLDNMKPVCEEEVVK